MARNRSRGRDPGALLSAPGRRWLLLIHQLPSKPDYFRVKIWRRLQRIGAVAIKSSVYALPLGEESAEHFQWMVREIAAAGGEASVCDAAFVDGLSDGQVEALFRAARGADYAAIAEEAEGLLGALPGSRALEIDQRGETEAALSRLRRRLGEIVAIDFFETPSRRLAEAALGRLEERMRTPPGKRAAPQPKRPRGKASGRTWVTRRGVYVDRIASAWLIRKFIDPRAKFRFVEEGEYRPAANEVRFDMFEAEYTHEGDRCSFEVLLEHFQLTDPGLKVLGEMVHDIDLRDSKFGRPETAGLERLIDGIGRAHRADEERIGQGAAVLDALYESLRVERP